jgi:hypothetical protein
VLCGATSRRRFSHVSRAALAAKPSTKRSEIGPPTAHENPKLAIVVERTSKAPHREALAIVEAYFSVGLA